MRLSHIAIRDLAGIRDTRIDDLEPGINVLIGDNEAGKSTILTALRAAIFYRHSSNSQTVKDLAPYARTARPEIDLEFELGGTAYRLEKRFLQKAEARLLSSAGDLAGEAVEERLAELFGFAPTRGGFKFDEHQGAFGLLWVEQGRSTQGLDLGAGRDAVAASLEAEVGQILGGDRGRALIAAAKALRDRHYTATGKIATSSALALAEKELAALELNLDERRAVRHRLDAAIDRLADLRRIVAGYTRERIIDTALEAVAAAEGAERGLEARRRDLREAEQALEIAAAATERAGAEHRRREELKGASEGAAATGRAKGAELDAARVTLDALVAEIEPKEAAHRGTVAALRELEDELHHTERAGRLSEIELRLRRLRETIDAARKAATRVVSAKARLSRRALNAASLKTILDAASACREVAAGRDAGAPTLLFHPDAGQAVSIEGGDGMALAPGAPHRLTSRTRFRLEGFGYLEVVPDAASQTREAAHRKAVAVLEEHLRAAGVASPEEAGRLAEETRQAEADLREAEIELKARAPEGLAAIEAEERQLTGESAELEAPSSQALRALAAIRSDIEAGKGRLKSTEHALDEIRREVARAETQTARAETLREAADADAARLSRLLAEQRESVADAALAGRLATAELMRTAKVVVVTALRAEYESADPDAIRAELARAEGVLRNARRDLGSVEAEMRDLEAEIRQTGGLGIGEDILRLESEFEETSARLSRLRLEAQASLLLHDTLKRAEARVRQTWFAPIRREVEPYLRLIHPGSEVLLDDATLAIAKITRGGVEEDFRRLSAGAREQVAVVTRLALAQVLRRGGHPAAVILDDALVNTDEQRLSRMHLVLRKAAEDLQIIVLTCRERDFRNLGGRIFRL